MADRYEGDDGLDVIDLGYQFWEFETDENGRPIISPETLLNTDAIVEEQIHEALPDRFEPDPGTDDIGGEFGDDEDGSGGEGPEIVPDSFKTGKSCENHILHI